MELKTGSTVKLVSGGPIMTIKGIIGDAHSPVNKHEHLVYTATGSVAGDIVCEWFDNRNELKSGVFKPSMLKLAHV